ncbi:MAG: ABC transporter ATP-binding protein [Luteolibacter sp.]|uniref:ABC transporter ATP-binding protein n=1 Tax=Luteolibacter sp. TaxID=1962973 RepID=UPI0032643A05
MADAALKKTGELIYEAIGLKKQFDNGKVVALRGLDLEIRQGEFVAIIGPSGCGKSTLLQMLGSLDKPSEGKLNYRGKSLPDFEDHAAYRSHEVGIIFQSFHLLPTFTVLENVQIPMFEGKASRSERKTRATELLESVGLGHRLSHFPSELSGGERQRVAIARSLVNNPSVLLADEPTGNLDSVSAVQIIDLLVEVHHRLGVTLVLVTHDPSVAERASRIIQMKDGVVISDRLANSN